MKFLNKVSGRNARDSVIWLEVEELAASLNSLSAPLVIDVRGAGEFDGPLGHIDEAQNIPLEQIPIRISDLVGEDRDLVLVCHTDRRSATAAEHIRRAGGKHVSVLRGGMVAWRSRQAR